MMRSMMGNKATRSQSTAKSPSPDRSDPCRPRAFRHYLVLSRKHDILILAVIFPFGGQEQLRQKQVGAVPLSRETTPARSWTSGQESRWAHQESLHSLSTFCGRCYLHWSRVSKSAPLRALLRFPVPGARKSFQWTGFSKSGTEVARASHHTPHLAAVQGKAPGQRPLPTPTPCCSSGQRPPGGADHDQAQARVPHCGSCLGPQLPVLQGLLQASANWQLKPSHATLEAQSTPLPETRPPSSSIAQLGPRTNSRRHQPRDAQDSESQFTARSLWSAAGHRAKNLGFQNRIDRSKFLRLSSTAHCLSRDMLVRHMSCPARLDRKSSVIAWLGKANGHRSSGGEVLSCCSTQGVAPGPQHRRIADVGGNRVDCLLHVRVNVWIFALWETAAVD